MVLYSFYLFFFYSFDGDIPHRNEILAQKLSNPKIQSLINGSGINNIPGLDILTSNPIVNHANACGNGIVYVGNLGTDESCRITCASSDAKVIYVEPDDTYIYDSVVLKPGSYCTIRDRPQCNTSMTYVVMTVNTVTCKSKFPELVGGKLGNTIVACNNSQIIDPRNYLWDNKYDRYFNPFNTIITDTDEKLSSDGTTYRFECIFQGKDEKQNLYMRNPNNRLHPIRNYCASEIFSSEGIETIFNPDGSYTCDCGKDNQIVNIDPNDKKSFCSSDSNRISIDKFRNKETIKLPYKCFTLYSPISEVGQYLPCDNDQFYRKGSQFRTVTIPISQNPNKLVEHPLYETLVADDGVFMPIGKKINETKIDFTVLKPN